MRKLNYIYSLLLFLPCLLFAVSFSRAEAVTVEYGTVLDTKGTSVLVDYYAVDKKEYYICNVTTLACTATTKMTLGGTTALPIKATLKKQLAAKNADHLTLSASKNLLAYYIQRSDAKPIRTFTIRNIKTAKEYSVQESVGYWDLINEQHNIYSFSPDSKKLVYLDDKDGQSSIYMVNTSTLSGTTFKSSKLPTTALQVSEVVFTDNNTLYYIGNSKDNPYQWSLYRYNLKTNKDLAIVTDVSYVDPLIKVGSSVVFNQLQALGYGIALYDTVAKKAHQFSTPGIDTKSDLSGEQVVHIGNQTGVVMAPLNMDPLKTYPLVIWLHGGPDRQSSYGYQPYHSYGLYDSILKLMQNDNVIILKLDYRGSLGLGRAYSESIKDSVGLGDVTDVMEAVAYMQNGYHVSNTYLAGNSYGGYLSLKTLVEHPNTFAGVLSINGVTDWASLLIPLKNSIFNVDFNGLPNPSNQALYDQASILNKIGNLGNQKVEIIQGQADQTINPSQAELLYNALTASHKNVSIVRYPGEDHVFKYPQTISDLCTQMFTFVGVAPDAQCITN
jgi:dipeptidyl aminopeptidase/acylaminoacyl peptidase